MLNHFPSLLLELSRPNQTLLRTKQLHALITTSKLFHDPFYATKIVRFYALSDDVLSARKLFDKTPQRSVFLWNSMIRAYAKSRELGESLSLYRSMLISDVKPDNFTYACLVRGCYENFDFDGLRLVHGGIIVSGLGLDPVTCSSLVTAYSKMELIDDASKVFCGVLEPDLVMWNSMISGYGQSGFWGRSLQLFTEMQESGKCLPDGYTFVVLISGLEDPNMLGLGQGLHGLCFKCGFDRNAHVGSALVSMYSRFKYMDSAYCVFGGLWQRDLVSWSALISGYSQSGDYAAALLIYRTLNVEGKKSDPVLVASVLVAASQSADIRPGTEIHGYVLRHGFESNVKVSSALVDMYFKCGFVDMGIRVFGHMPNKNIISYNSVISNLGLHGLASQAFEMFEEVLEKGLRPDECTFSALLSACCHSGLVKDGREIFRRMTDEFCIEAKTEHYVHFVKLLGMAGKLKEAYSFILSLTQPVDSGVWGALLACCDTHGHTELAEIIAKQLFEHEPQRGAYRVMLSNIYASDGRWDDVKSMRDDITNPGGWKIPGLSWIGD